jgi:HEAT repeats
VPTDRATARAELANRSLAATAAERVVRTALDGLPVSLVARATTQLRRFFSGGSWSADDDAALSAAIGPGSGWYEEELDPELTLGFGWRGGAFRTEVRYEPAAIDVDTAVASDSPAARDQHERTLGDTFEDAVALESGRAPTELCFRIGPSSAVNATFTRDNAGTDTRIAAAFAACPSLTQISAGAGTLTAKVDHASHWADELLALIDTIATEFTPPRAAPADRQLERARSELGALRHDNSRDLARILDATTSPDAAFRRIAIERLTGADSTVALRPLTRALDDSSRAVRRVAAQVLAQSARTETRDLLERALGDADACVRYYAARGLYAIGPTPSLAALHHRRADSDPRVKVAVEAALEGRTPA